MSYFLRNKFGIVLTDQRVVVGLNGSLIFNTVSSVTRHKPTGQLLCAGPAFCLGKYNDVVVSNPIRLGVVQDFEGASFMLKYYIKDRASWFHRMNPKKNFAMRGCLTENEIRALSDCYSGKANQMFYMQEIIATILGMDKVIIIYVADDFIEIAYLTDYKIDRLFVEEFALEEFRNRIMEFVIKNKVRIGERTLRSIIGAFFGGDEIVVCAPHTTSSMTQQLSFDTEDLLSVTSFWFDRVKGYIDDFIKEHDFDVKLYLMSDYNKVNYLTHELSSRCNIKIEPINNALEKIAINLSRR